MYLLIQLEMITGQGTNTYLHPNMYLLIQAAHSKRSHHYRLLHSNMYLLILVKAADVIKIIIFYIPTCIY